MRNDLRTQLGQLTKQQRLKQGEALRAEWTYRLVRLDGSHTTYATFNQACTAARTAGLESYIVVQLNTRTGVTRIAREVIYGRR